MFIQSLIILLGIPILIIPLFFPIVKEKRLTTSGIIFIIICVGFAFLQFFNERTNSRKEAQLMNDKIELKYSLDSLVTQTKGLTDTLSIFRSALFSIDKQFGETSKKVSSLGRMNDSLNTKIIESDRPQFVITSSKINKSSSPDEPSFIDFIFINQGKRSAINVFGKMYISFRDTTWDTGTISISRSDIFTNNHGFELHYPMKFEPTLATFENPIYYYFKITYSDIVLDTIYPFDLALKVSPALQTELTMCKEWEVENIRKTLKLK